MCSHCTHTTICKISDQNENVYVCLYIYMRMCGHSFEQYFACENSLLYFTSPWNKILKIGRGSVGRRARWRVWLFHTYENHSNHFTRLTPWTSKTLCTQSNQAKAFKTFSNEFPLSAGTRKRILGLQLTREFSNPTPKDEEGFLESIGNCGSPLRLRHYAPLPLRVGNTDIWKQEHHMAS